MMHRKEIEVEGVRQVQYSFKTPREMYDFMGWDTSDVDPKYLDYESDSGDMATMAVKADEELPNYKNLNMSVESIAFSASNSGPAPLWITIKGGDEE